MSAWCQYVVTAVQDGVAPASSNTFPFTADDVAAICFFFILSVNAHRSSPNRLTADRSISTSSASHFSLHKRMGQQSASTWNHSIDIPMWRSSIWYLQQACQFGQFGESGTSSRKDLTDLCSWRHDVEKRIWCGWWTSRRRSYSQSAAAGSGDQILTLVPPDSNLLYADVLVCWSLRASAEERERDSYYTYSFHCEK